MTAMSAPSTSVTRVAKPDQLTQPSPSIREDLVRTSLNRDYDAQMSHDGACCEWRHGPRRRLEKPRLRFRRQDDNCKRPKPWVDECFGGSECVTRLLQLALPFA